MPLKINEIPLTAAELNEMFRYDGATGKLYNRITRGKRARKGLEAGCTRPEGYRMVKIAGVGYYTHRLIWKMRTGSDPAEEMDHINHDRTDNRIENLREVTHSEQVKNASRRKDNTSGVTGVHWDTRDQKWQVQIRVEGNQRYLGSFTHFFHAVRARKLAEVGAGFHVNHGEAA